MQPIPADTTPPSPQLVAHDLLSLVCAHVYAFGSLPSPSSLDPHFSCEAGIPISLPSTFPAATWSEPISRGTLSSLCLVNHAWYEAAKPWLWRKIQVRLPRSWLALVEQIVWNEDLADLDPVAEMSIKAAAKATKDAQGTVRDLEKSIFDEIALTAPSVPYELLTPPASREPSPRRIRAKSKSPARWEIVKSIRHAIEDMIFSREPGLHVPIPDDPRPGRFIRHLDFNHFRTIGMRRSVEEGVNSRFVTGDLLRAVLKEMPSLVSFGATEYMDGALTLDVLEELFLRGAPSGGRGRPARGRTLDLHDVEEEDRERRRQCTDLVAIDLTGCVSAVFVNSIAKFVEQHILPLDDDERPAPSDDSRTPRPPADEDSLIFPGLLRLGLRGVKSIHPQILIPFVMAFPSLTHLDLSGTRATHELLQALGSSPSIRLHSLALSKCIHLTSESIRSLLVDSATTVTLRELNLYGDATFPSSLTERDLLDIVSHAPCFVSEDLEYLDLSSSPVTQAVLDVHRPQPQLRSLGLCHIPNLDIKSISNFLKFKASKVEVLALVGTSPDLDCGLRADGVRGTPRTASVQLHTHLIRPLCTSPFSFSLSANSTPAPPPTMLRVIELSKVLLTGLGAGAGTWRIVRSKGGRGWYVDTASGWVAEPGRQEVYARNLPESHPYRAEMCKLAGANGNVSSGVGWHARKMEVLHGHGMLGRESGLYGAVAFAYSG